MTPSTPSPTAVGSSVTLSASSATCASPEYEFWEQDPGGDYVIAQAYSAATSYNWTPAAAGVYSFEVWARDASSTAAYDAYTTLTYTADPACASAEISASTASPAAVGTAVTLTGTSSTCGTPEYQFWEQDPGGSYFIAQPYSATATYDWTGTVAGTYAFEVWVRDAGSQADYDTWASLTYELDPTALTLPRLVTNAYCTHASTCCVGSASASFNEAKCESDSVADEYVPLTNLGIILNGLSSPNFTFSVTNANACITAIGNLSCGSNSADDLANVVSTCSSAYIAALPMGASGCASSFDCESGYCAPFMADSNGVPVPPPGGGTCSPLLTIGSTCADTDLSSDCTYGPGSVPAAFCATGAGGGPVCQAAQSDGTDCSATYEDQECISGQCQPSGATDYTCQAAALFTELFGNDVCTLYAQ